VLFANLGRNVKAAHRNLGLLRSIFFVTKYYNKVLKTPEPNRLIDEV